MSQSTPDYEEFVAETRRRLVAAIVKRRSGHLCSSLSAIDIICTVLLREWDAQLGQLRSDVVLSKGHAAPAYYAALGILAPELPPLEENLRRIGSPYEGHPRRDSMPYVPVSTGSLGIGLAWSVGRAIALEREGVPRRVVVLASDGELQAGLSFEALRLAAHMRTKPLTIVVDFNGWQTDGPVGLDPVRLLRGIGLDVHVVHGHSANEIGSALASSRLSGPVAIVARTERCAGLPDRYRRGPELYGERITDADARLLMISTARGAAER